MLRLTLKLTLITAAFCVLAFAAGYWTAAHNADLPECGLTTTAAGSYCYRIEPDCSTDAECEKKYGE